MIGQGKLNLFHGRVSRERKNFLGGVEQISWVAIHLEGSEVRPWGGGSSAELAEALAMNFVISGSKSTVA